MTLRPYRSPFPLLLSLLLGLGCSVSMADKNEHKSAKHWKHHSPTSVTLIEMGDLHGTLIPHAAVLKDDGGAERQVNSAGGLARLKTVVDDIRARKPGALLLSAGDLTHGSAETLFTVGDAMMVAMNAFGIDAFTPGNWDFGYGPAVFRNRFANRPPFPTIPPNIRVMAGYIDCDDIPEIPGLTDTSSGYGCGENTATMPNPTPVGAGIIKAQFPSTAINVYNDAPVGNRNRVLDPYLTFERHGVKIAVIGITASIVPQQADVFNIGLRFTQGVEELPGIIEEVKDGGADLIVVQSELGLSQNIEIARRFKDIDVMYSAHTHEITLGALLADKHGVTATTPGLPLSGAERNRLARGAAIVVETNRDMYVGELDVQVAGGKIVDFTWHAHVVDDKVRPDPDMEKLVAWIEEDFVPGEDGEVRTHVFLPGAFCNPGCGEPGERGHYLGEDLDKVVGGTDTLLLRHHVLEDTLNNWLADAIRVESNEVVSRESNDPWDGVDISMSNGFRFGNAVLPHTNITLRDLYTWFPVGPAVNIGEFAGQSIEASLEEILGAVFNRNPFLQRGGWYLGLGNMKQTVDLKNRPFSSSSGRIVETRIGDEALDTSRRYVFASCYAHGDAIDRVCRTGGGSEHRFFELADAMDYNSTISIVDPVNVAFPPGGAVKRVAPYRYVHPIHLLRRHLDSIGTVSEFDYGVSRIMTVDSSKVGNPEEDQESQIGQPGNTPDTGLVQPPYGAGPAFFSGHVNH